MLSIPPSPRANIISSEASYILTIIYFQMWIVLKLTLTYVTDMNRLVNAGDVQIAWLHLQSSVTRHTIVARNAPLLRVAHVMCIYIYIYIYINWNPSSPTPLFHTHPHTHILSHKRTKAHTSKVGPNENKDKQYTNCVRTDV